MCQIQSVFLDFLADFVIHMDTILEDSLCLLQLTRGLDMATAMSSLKHVNMSPKGHSSAKEIQAKYFSQLDETLLNRLQNKYWPDFLLHGYTLEPYLVFLNKTDDFW